MEDKVIAYRTKWLITMIPMYCILALHQLIIGIVIDWHLWFTILMFASSGVIALVMFWLVYELLITPKILIKYENSNLICRPRRSIIISIPVHEIISVKNAFRWNGLEKAHTFFIESNNGRIKLSWIAGHRQVKSFIEALISKADQNIMSLD